MSLNNSTIKVISDCKRTILFIAAVFLSTSSSLAYEINPASSTVNYGNTSVSIPVTSTTNSFNFLIPEILPPIQPIISITPSRPIQPVVNPVIILFDKNSIKDKLLKGEIKVINGQIIADTVLEQSNFSSAVNPGKIIHSTQAILNSDGTFSLMPATAKLNK